jgi:hypothetical protein
LGFSIFMQFLAASGECVLVHCLLQTSDSQSYFDWKMVSVFQNHKFISATCHAYHLCFQSYRSSFEVYSVVFFLTLSLLEYINYFEVQLMYDYKADRAYIRQAKRLKTAKPKQLMSIEKTRNEGRHRSNPCPLAVSKQ